MRKSFAKGMLFGSLLTALSIILMAPANEQLYLQELEVEEELLKVKLKQDAEQKKRDKQ